MGEGYIQIYKSIYCGINNTEPDRGAHTVRAGEEETAAEGERDKEEQHKDEDKQEQQQQQEQLNGTKRAQAKRCNGSESQSKSVWSGILGPSVEKVLF